MTFPSFPRGGRSTGRTWRTGLSTPSVARGESRPSRTFYSITSEIRNPSGCDFGGHPRGGTRPLHAPNLDWSARDPQSGFPATSRRRQKPTQARGRGGARLSGRCLLPPRYLGGLRIDSRERRTPRLSRGSADEASQTRTGNLLGAIKARTHARGVRTERAAASALCCPLGCPRLILSTRGFNP